MTQIVGIKVASPKDDEPAGRRLRGLLEKLRPGEGVLLARKRGRRHHLTARIVRLHAEAVSHLNQEERS
jgi:hypothetical protein